MPERHPDIEVHLKGPAFNDMDRWLQAHFNINAVTRQDLGRLLDHKLNYETYNARLLKESPKDDMPPSGSSRTKHLAE